MPFLGGVVTNETGDLVPGPKTFTVTGGANPTRLQYFDPQLPAGQYLIYGYSFAVCIQSQAQVAGPKYSAALFVASGSAAGPSGRHAIDSVTGEAGVQAVVDLNGFGNQTGLWVPATQHQVTLAQPLPITLPPQSGIFVILQSRNGISFNTSGVTPCVLTYALQLAGQ